MKLTGTHYSIEAADRGGAYGLKLALLSDLHNADPGPVLRVLEKEAPDLVMIPGDVILGYFPDEDGLVIDRCGNVISFLKSCAEIAPTYMSVGNHECLLCDEDLDGIRRTGVTLLDNEWSETARPHGGDRLLIGGLTSAIVLNYRGFRERYNRGRTGADYVKYPRRKRVRDIAALRTESGWLDGFAAEEGYKILLCHHPEYWCVREPAIRDKKIDLMLSGHAHGGQWRIFGRGIYAPGQGFMPEYTSGVHKGPHGSLVISRGLSNPYSWLPRIGNPCEAVFISI